MKAKLFLSSFLIVSLMACGKTDTILSAAPEFQSENQKPKNPEGTFFLEVPELTICETNPEKSFVSVKLISKHTQNSFMYQIPYREKKIQIDRVLTGKYEVQIQVLVDGKAVYRGNTEVEISSNSVAAAEVALTHVEENVGSLEIKIKPPVSVPTVVPSVPPKASPTPIKTQEVKPLFYSAAENEPLSCILSFVPLKENVAPIVAVQLLPKDNDLEAIVTAQVKEACADKVSLGVHSQPGKPIVLRAGYSLEHTSSQCDGPTSNKVFKTLLKHENTVAPESLTVSLDPYCTKKFVLEKERVPVSSPVKE